MVEAIHFVRSLAIPEISPEDTVRLESIHCAAAKNDGIALPELLRMLSPPQPYLRKRLFAAVSQGKIAAARCLLDANTEIDGSILFAACFRTKSIEMFELLLEYGWNVNAVFGGKTALTMLIEHDHLVRWLIAHGASASLGRQQLWDFQSTSAFTTKSGHALYNASGGSTVEIFDLLVESGAPLILSLALHSAAAAPFTEERKRMMVHLIEDYHMDVDGPDKEIMGPRRRGTPLFYAATSGNVGGVRLLLEQGANPTLRDHRGATAADEAERLGKQEIADLLREAFKDSTPGSDETYSFKV